MNSDRYCGILTSLNGAQLGSLGEFLAITHYKEQQAEVVILHKLERDLSVKLNGETRHIDVKAHRYLATTLSEESIRPYYGKRVDHVSYEQVFFFLDAVVYVGPYYNRQESLQVLSRWELPQLATLIAEWLKGESYPATHLDKDEVRTNIRTEIESWYSEEIASRPIPRALFRGPASPTRNGVRDLPHNLPGTKATVDAHPATIFVQMKIGAQGNEEIDFIVAYPHSHLKKLPHLEGNIMARQKGCAQVLDLPRIIYSFRSYYFGDLDLLMSEYSRRFPATERTASSLNAGQDPSP